MLDLNLVCLDFGSMINYYRVWIGKKANILALEVACKVDYLGFQLRIKKKNNGKIREENNAFITMFMFLL